MGKHADNANRPRGRYPVPRAVLAPLPRLRLHRRVLTVGDKHAPRVNRQAASVDRLPSRGAGRPDLHAAWPTPAEDFILAEGQRYEWFTLTDALVLPDLADYARDSLAAFRDRLAQAR